VVERIAERQHGERQRIVVSQKCHRFSFLHSLGEVDNRQNDEHDDEQSDQAVAVDNHYASPPIQRMLLSLSLNRAMSPLENITRSSR
jgi:hypothetical protein